MQGRLVTDEGKREIDGDGRKGKGHKKKEEQGDEGTFTAL